MRPGETIAHFRVAEKLGEGGMGVVYKAWDTALDRFVALKVLPADKVAGPERRQRFVQEARAASALNHPNIITIYEIFTHQGAEHIAMEFVAGTTLEQKIAGQPLPVKEALRYAAQVAAALARAHAAGIVHRDLKPANIMITSDGAAKVLDFGLAKLTEIGSSTDDEPTASITLPTSPRTEEGTVVGTAAYMSPEQAEGKSVDARSDIFSFGTVLYEMLTGRRAFRGKTSMSIMSSILRDEPAAVTTLVPTLPPELERVVTRCLRKDPERRAQSMADLKVLLEDLREEADSGKLASAAPAATTRKSPIGWAAAAIIALVLISGAWLYLRRPPQSAPRLVPLTSSPGRELSPAFSPDGKQVAFVWSQPNEENYDIYVKLVGGDMPLRLTTNPARDLSPAWSPDGRWIAFARVGDDPAIFLVPALGGPERRIAPLTSAAVDSYLADAGAMEWTPDGKSLIIVDSDTPGGACHLALLSVETGQKQPLTKPPASSSGDSFGVLSPDGTKLAFVRSFGDLVADVYRVSFSNGTTRGDPARLTFDNQDLWGLAWTPDSRELVFSSNRDGLYALWRIPASGGAPRRLAGAGPDAILPAIARAGNLLAYSVWAVNWNIWRRSLGAEGAPERVITSTRREFDPQYSPDGSRIASVSDRSGGRQLFVSDANGANSIALTSLPGVANPRWSPDGSRIAFAARPAGNVDVYVVPAQGGAPRRITTDPGPDTLPSWSADGKWIYFDSQRSGRDEIWKNLADGSAKPVQVTHNGGRAVRESADGQLLYIQNGRNAILKMPVAGGPETTLLESVADVSWEIAKDGIYFVRRDASSLFFLDFGTGSVREVARIDAIGRPYGISISPDGRSILYVQKDTVNQDILMVEDFK